MIKCAGKTTPDNGIKTGGSQDNNNYSVSDCLKNS